MKLRRAMRALIGSGRTCSGLADRDQGAATALAAAVAMALLAVLWSGVQLGSALITRHHAEGAADLAALAAAAHAVQGAEFACAQADRVAAEMRMAISSCRLEGWDARVEVDGTRPGVLAKVAPVHARARAGPVE